MLSLVKVQMPGSGVIVEVTPEKAERLGWPAAPVEAKRPAVKK